MELPNIGQLYKDIDKVKIDNKISDDPYKNFIKFLYNSTHYNTLVVEEIDKNYGLDNIYNFIKDNNVYVVQSPKFILWCHKKGNFFTKSYFVSDGGKIENIDKNKLIILYSSNIYGIRYAEIDISENFVAFDKNKLRKKLRHLKLDKINEV